MTMITLQPLTGVSEKQIAYGEDVRAKIAAQLESRIAQLLQRRAKAGLADESARMLEAAARAFATQPTAKWWIEADMPLKALSEAYMTALREFGRGVVDMTINHETRGPGRPRQADAPRARTAFNLPVALLSRLEDHVSIGNRSQFVEQAIRAHLADRWPVWDQQTPVKQVAIGVRTYQDDDGTPLVRYVVSVRVYGPGGALIDGTEEPFRALAAAQTYAADVMARDLRPVELGTLLQER